MKRWLRWALVAVLGVSGTGSANAQVGFRANSYLSYTSNLFQNYSRRSDWVTLTYIDFYYAPRPSLSLYYTGNANVFAEYGDLFSHSHQIGVGYARSGKGRNAVYAGAEAGLRIDLPVYNYYDYFESRAYLNVKHYLRPSLLFRGGAQLRYREYGQAGNYSYVEPSLSGELTRFLKTRTTLQIRGSLGAKVFTRSAGPDSSDLVVLTRAGGVQALAQATLRAKVAQAVATNTGVQFSYQHRINIVGQNRYAELDGYNTDDDLFDDRYSYAGGELNGVIKHRTTSNWELEFSGRVERRNYEARPALDLDGFQIGIDATREDVRKSVTGEVSRTFRLTRGWIRELGVHVEWSYLHQASNDPYYDTTGHVQSVGLQLGF